MERNQIDGKYKWKLETMYASDAAWEADYKYVSGEIKKTGGYEGKLNDPKTISACLKFCDAVSGKLELMAVYAHCRRDEDTSADKYNAMYGRITTLHTDFAAAAAFIEPELCALPVEKLKELAKSPAFGDYDYMLKTLIKNIPHILSKPEEKLLAKMSDFASGFENTFTMLDNADIETPVIKADGKDIPLTHGAYGALLQHGDRSVRRQAFELHHGFYKKMINTITANYAGEVKKNVFYSDARGFESYLDKALHSEDVPKEVYLKLVEAVSAGTPSMHKYMALRKKTMGLDKLQMWDLHVPITGGVKCSYEYGDAYKLVKEGLSPLGREYAALLDSAYSDGWIDVYETRGKRSGGYCTHANAAPHPYILLNYNGTLNEVFTIAHELGHAMHSYFSAKAQPYPKADYKIFVAEVASTVNEMLLLDYLLKGAKDADTKKYLLSYRLNSVRTTIFRQTMFSEFELKAHATAEKGKPLTVKELCGLYAKLNAKYYGPEIAPDGFIQYEWARIPHFYRAFYVYKYATGLTAAINIGDKILTEKGYLETYMKFLSAGGSDSPYAILKNAGVDLAAAEPYKKVTDIFDKTVEELEKLDKEKG